jgi:hypothetical protein
MLPELDWDAWMTYWAGRNGGDGMVARAAALLLLPSVRLACLLLPRSYSCDRLLDMPDRTLAGIFSLAAPLYMRMVCFACGLIRNWEAVSSTKNLS